MLYVFHRIHHVESTRSTEMNALGSPCLQERVSTRLQDVLVFVSVAGQQEILWERGFSPVCKMCCSLAG